MHLALVIASLGPGGAERVLTDLANHWAGQGHDVALITLSGGEDRPFYPVDERVSLVRLGVMSGDEAGLIQRVGSIVRRIRRLRQTLKRLKPDRVLSFVDITNLTTLLACLGLKVPVVVSERSHPVHHDIPSLYVWARQWLYRMAVSVVVQTVSASRYFDSLTNVCVIPNMVREPTSHAVIQKDVRIIVSSGRLIPSKGFEDLIQAFSTLASVYPDIQLVIYGEGPYRGILKSQIEHEHLADRVKLPGAVQNVTDELKEADLFVFPSHYEGFPNALCEAMSVGLPVVASCCSGNVDVVHDGVNGRLFPVGDITAISSLMVELIEDVDQRYRLSHEARFIVQRLKRESILHLWDDVMTWDERCGHDKK